jgi:hypothetical protein
LEQKFLRKILEGNEDEVIELLGEAEEEAAKKLINISSR